MLIPESAEDPPSCMPLLSGQLAVIFQPSINDGDIRPQRGVVFRCEVRQGFLAPVLLIGILLDGTVIEAGCFLDFRQILALDLIEVLDVLFLSHMQHLSFYLL